MFRFIGIIAVIFLIYRWIVRPLLILPKAKRESPSNTNQPQFDFLNELLKKSQQEQQRSSPNAASDKGKGQSRRNKNDEEYTDYEEVD